MTKKKRELIDILLDNVKPEDWPEHLPYAAQDIKSMNVDYPIYAYQCKPVNSDAFPEMWDQDGYSRAIKICGISKELCKHWNKTIVHRDEFMKRWNERNPVVDSEGWIQWNGGEMPVEKGTLIDVKYRDVTVNLHVKAGEIPSGGSIPRICAIDFKHNDVPGDIIAYRLHAPRVQKTPQQFALEKFSTDWHENEGVQPELDGVLIDIRLSETGVYNKEYASTWNWSLSESNFIEKWRIHSDQAALLREPMSPCSEEIPFRFVDEKSPLETQIGGDHYTKLAIQPIRYSMENGLDALQHTVIKYVTRFRDKAGIEDLEKAKHCIDMLIEYEKESK